MTIYLLFLWTIRDANAEVSSRSYTTVMPDNCVTTAELTAAAATYTECAVICAHPGTDCSYFLYCPKEELCVIGGKASPSDFPECECYARVCENGGKSVGGSCECFPGYYDDHCEHIISDCTEGMARGFSGNEVEAFIQPAGTSEPMMVLCGFDYGFTYISYRRASNCSHESFDRGWDDYVHGFGSFRCEFWLGLEKLHLLTSQGTYQLEILVDYEDDYRQCYFSPFRVHSETSGFRAAMTNGTSNNFCNDFLHGGSGFDINGQVFSTKDNNATGSTCANKMKGGWWYGQVCGNSNMNGPYINSEEFAATPAEIRLSPGEPLATKWIKRLILRVKRL